MTKAMNRALALALAIPLLAALPAAAASPRIAGATFDEQFKQLQELARDSSLDATLSSTLLALLDEASGNVGDQQSFVGTTQTLARQLLTTPTDYIDDFATQYNAAFQQQTKFKWEWHVNPVQKCDDNFNCVFPGTVCLLITWSDGHGSGGINCISPTVQSN